MKKLRWLLFALCIASARETAAVGSAGIGNNVVSAKALGFGGAGTAAMLEDPTSVYSNPAGLMSLPGTWISGGGAWEDLHGHYSSHSGSEKSDMRSIDVFVPNVALTHQLIDDRLGVGLALLSDYGLETHWPGDGPLRYMATNSRLRTANISTAIAYRLNSALSVGIGSDYVTVPLADLEKNVNVNNLNASLGAPTATAPDAVSHLSGTGADWGFHAGLQYQPSKTHAIGVTYHSKVTLNINGSVSLSGLSGASTVPFGGSEFASSAYTSLSLPQNIQLGYAWRPTERWTFEADAGWYQWDMNQDLNVRYPAASATQIAILTNNGAGNPQPLDSRNTWDVAFGANYQVSKRLELRGGYYYLPWTMLESAFHPGFMDLSRHGITLGTGWAVSDSFTVDLGYNAVFMEERSITNTLGFAQTGDPSVTASGRYSNFVNVFALNLTYRTKGFRRR